VRKVFFRASWKELVTRNRYGIEGTVASTMIMLVTEPVSSPFVHLIIPHHYESPLAWVSISSVSISVHKSPLSPWKKLTLIVKVN
jgi:hypothetical protein